MSIMLKNVINQLLTAEHQTEVTLRISIKFCR